MRKASWFARCAALVVIVLIVAMQAQAGREVVLHHFGSNHAANPGGALIRDALGNFYGTDYSADLGIYGSVYRLDSAGHYTLLHAFQGSPADGANPVGSLALDADGNIYGATQTGGSMNLGILYKIDPSGQETVLYSFTAPQVGSPITGVLRDGAGNLYGMAGSSGPWWAVVYKLDATGQFSVFITLQLGNAGGGTSSLTMDAAGNMYGANPYYGPKGYGLVFKVSSSGDFSILYGFDGAGPVGGVAIDADGNVYGTTQGGGPGNHGVIYKLDPAGNYSILYNFPSTSGYSNSTVALDAAGNIYGTIGGAGPNEGEVYKLDTSGEFTVLYSFTGDADGGNPIGLQADSAGNLYGITSSGGLFKGGVAFELNPAGQETILRNFGDGVRGSAPLSGVIRDSSGNLYGTSYYGGTGPGRKGNGVVYELDDHGRYRVLHEFGSRPQDALQPHGKLILDATGVLYGTSLMGGAKNVGSVYQVDLARHERVVHSFRPKNGDFPESGITRDSDGNLYGTLCGDGPGGLGAVFKLDASGHETILYSFTGKRDGGCPDSSLVRDAQGNLYGTTSGGGKGRVGAVYKLDQAGRERVLYSFSGGADGGDPAYGLVRDAAGNLYGTTILGGVAGTCQGSAFGCGVVYKVSATGQETVLHAFTGGLDGGFPSSGVIRDPAGNLYGTAYVGGTSGPCTIPQAVSSLVTAGCGVVYKIDSAGNFSILYSFTGQFDGGVPAGGVVLSPEGDLFGVTNQGRRTHTGVIYKIEPN